jgi:hypothetical protein
MPLEFIDEIWTKGKFIHFRNLGKLNGSRGTPRVTNTYEVLAEGDVKLGEIRWFARWRKYCFFPETETVYEETCLDDISDFLVHETLAHKEAKT